MVERLHELANLVDSCGSKVRLQNGSVCEGPRQPVPYPAVVRDCKCVQSYAWVSDQHINVLELVAFSIILNACRRIFINIFIVSFTC